MGRRRLTLFALMGLLAVLSMWLAPERVPTYRGQTVTEWETEIGNWEPFLTSWSNKTGRRTWWVRQDAFDSSAEWPQMPLLAGNSDSVPVLTRLLGSQSRRVRLLAAEGLESIGEDARPAIPTLLRRLDDPDPETRQQISQTLYRVDQVTAERIGLRWDRMLGLVRRESEP